MFRHILVPLDGSELAEQALPIAAQIARASQVSLLLLRAVSTQSRGGIAVREPSMRRSCSTKTPPTLCIPDKRPSGKRATNLQALTQGISSEEEMAREVNVSWSVEEGNDVAERLITIAESGKGIATREASDLIAMTTHGRSGLERWLMGSITERVVDGTRLPLLVVRPQQLTTSPSPVPRLEAV